MSFIDALTGQKITATCLITGHDRLETGYGVIVYQNQKKNAMKKDIIRKEYFKGNLTYCGRERCEWEMFEGDKVPFKKTITIDGIETEVE